ncbi:dynein assembly factor 4, axonemal-like [Cynoglossus semilaevis]|uniref:Dynein axonemal assembly factor 4 n=1 Tax=Cynoglossus semilaevis TaxID=244447 RepID=A0A3P8X301_CYNSE|nr:dynein assembly factor 4, axonemal-like [Cynoglossus semilaevis]
MPLLVKDYSWTQTETTVHIYVPLKGARAGKVDIVCTDEYLKMNYPPFLFEVFFFESVDNDKSTSKVGNGVAVISLPKRSPKMWEHLMITPCDKEMKKQIRESALQKQCDNLNSQSAAKAEKWRAEEKHLVEVMISCGKKVKDRIRNLKMAEQEKTITELEALRLSSKQTEEQEDSATTCNAQNDTKTQTKTTINGNDQHQQRESAAVARCKKTPSQLPALRCTGNIQVKFTTRVFQTPLRESKVQEEEEWLRKQAEARRIISADAEDLKELPEEHRNHEWLKDKGDAFVETGDYLSALNAYSLAIRLNRKIPALFSNRAVCHLKLGNLQNAVDDSSQAIVLLTPPVAANSEARARTHIHRGVAYCELQLYIEALQDFEAALTIRPDNEGLQKDAQTLRNVIQGQAISMPEN